MRHQRLATKIITLKRGSPERNKAERDANRSGRRCYLAPADGVEYVEIDGVDGRMAITAPVDVPVWVGVGALEADAPLVELSYEEYFKATDPEAWAKEAGVEEAEG